MILSIRFIATLFLSVTILLSSGCQTNLQRNSTATLPQSPQQTATLSPKPTLALPHEPTAELSISPTTVQPSTPVSVFIQDSLFSFIPLAWANAALPSSTLGPFLYYIDYARIRSELNLGSASGSSDPKDKRAYQSMIEKATQGLGMFPTSVQVTSDPLFYNKWGWDIPDISQALYLPDDEILFLLGSFNFQRIQTNLANQGLHQTQGEGYTLFQTAGLFYAFYSNVMVVGIKADQTSTFAKMALNRQQMGATVADHPLVQKLWNDPDHQWGMVLLPTPNLSAANALGTVLPPSVAQTEQAGLRVTNRIPSWDLMAASFTGLNGGIHLKFAYHFENAQAASADEEAIRQGLTATASFWYMGKKWSDLMSLDEVGVAGNIVSALATTTIRDLLGVSISTHDFGPFLAG